MQRIRYSFDGQGILAADGRAIATDLPTNPKSGADLLTLVTRANAAPALLEALTDVRALLADIGTTGWRQTMHLDTALAVRAKVLAAIASAEGRTNG